MFEHKLKDTIYVVQGQKNRSGWFSLSMKSSLFLIALLLMSLSLLGVLTLKSIEKYQKQQMEVAMAGRARTANLYLGQMLLLQSDGKSAHQNGGAATNVLLKKNAGELVKQLSNERALAVEVFDLQGSPLGTTNFLNNEPVDQKLTREGVQRAAQNKIVYKTLLSDSQKETQIEYFAPLYANEKVVGVLHLSYLDQGSYAFYDSMSKMILATGSGVFAFALLAALWYFGRMTRAVKSLEISVNRVRQGHYKGVEILKRQDELGKLSYGIGQMAETIESSMESLQSEHEKLSLAVGKLKAMEEGQRLFFGQITHEFKTPLSVINAYNDLATMYPDDEALLENSRKQIGDEVKKLSGMVEKALEIAKMEKYEFELINERIRLDELLQQAVDRLKVKVEKYGLEVQVSLEPVEINGDAQMMSQIFINLLDNAIKYNAAGGMIWVDLSTSETGSKVVIENTGEGLSEQVMERLFEAYTTDNSTNQTEVMGTGLGLPLVRRLVQLQKGQIEVTEGHADRRAENLPGCRVEIVFPRRMGLS